ncbi:hypothetical protein EI94DRAFT_1817155 [Lactarius quietus]|nr:hypothetical protein EI94DRAFT_1817155 [Lactarius quietus]
MPQIYSNSPAALLEGVDKDQALRWVQIPTGKILVRPFDADVHYQPNHQYIAIDLIAAVDEITGTKIASVAPPFKDKNSGVMGRHPTTFLIHNLTPYEVNTLLSRPVWSSKEIMFQVSPVMTKRPKFLFTLVGFTTLNTDAIHKAVMETWRDLTTVTFFDSLVLQAPESEKNSVTKGILDFIKSTEVRFLDIRREGNRREPHYNVYADEEHTNHRTAVEEESQKTSHADCATVATTQEGYAPSPRYQDGTAEETEQNRESPKNLHAEGQGTPEEH